MQTSQGEHLVDSPGFVSLPIKCHLLSGKATKTFSKMAGMELDNCRWVCGMVELISIKLLK